MDWTKAERKAEAETVGARAWPDERARAAAYLDLWERHVSLAAVLGPGPAAPRAPD